MQEFKKKEIRHKKESNETQIKRYINSEMKNSLDWAEYSLDITELKIGEF